MSDAQRIAERFFSAGESAQLNSLNEAERTAAFLNLWTRKEALAKATGVGIANSLARFAVTPDEPAAVTAIDGDARLAAQWTLHSFAPASGYLSTVAVHSCQVQFSLNHFHLPS